MKTERAVDRKIANLVRELKQETTPVLAILFLAKLNDEMYPWCIEVKDQVMESLDRMNNPKGAMASEK